MLKRIMGAAAGLLLLSACASLNNETPPPAPAPQTVDNIDHLGHFKYRLTPVQIQRLTQAGCNVDNPLPPKDQYVYCPYGGDIRAIANGTVVVPPPSASATATATATATAAASGKEASARAKASVEKTGTAKKKARAKTKYHRTAKKASVTIVKNRSGCFFETEQKIRVHLPYGGSADFGGAKIICSKDDPPASSNAAPPAASAAPKPLNTPAVPPSSPPAAPPSGTVMTPAPSSGGTLNKSPPK